VSLKCHADVLSFRMLQGVFVVFDEARFGSEDCVVTAHVAVFARKPVGTTLTKDNIPRNDVLFTRLFGSQSLSGTVLGAIGPTLSLMGGMSDEESRWFGGRIDGSQILYGLA